MKEKNKQFMPFFFFSRKKKEDINQCAFFDGKCMGHIDYENSIENFIENNICEILLYSPKFGWVHIPNKVD